MGLHDDLIADAVSVHADTFGETVVYIPPAGQAQTETDLQFVFVGHEWRERNVTGNAIEVIRMRSFTAIVDPNHERFCGVEKLADNGAIVYHDTRYGIERTSESTVQGEVVLTCRAMNFGRRQRQGMRG